MLGRDWNAVRLLMAALILGTASRRIRCGGWRRGRSASRRARSGSPTDGAQQVSLTQEGTLKPGDTIRTGRNGRVLLVRGEETILISPNSVVGLPAEKKDGLSTTIIQQAGSILLEVEKRNVKHFEVETPYLAAVVEGDAVQRHGGAGSTKVGVLRGQVEVSDFKTGQIAQVMPGQAATVFEHGKPGLSLSGAGTFNPIEHGKPARLDDRACPVPKSGLSAPRNAANGHAIHALGPIDKGTKAAGAPTQSHQAAGGHVAKAGVVRISSSLGEVKLNVHKVTNGLAHGAVAPDGCATRTPAPGPETVWSDGESKHAGLQQLRPDSGNDRAVRQPLASSASTASAAIAGSSASVHPATAPAASNGGKRQQRQ